MGRKAQIISVCFLYTFSRKSGRRLSRLKNEDTEWELNNSTFNLISETFGHPDIDIFATSSNTKCKNFISWIPDPKAAVIDAFTVPWTNLNFYAFPPFSQILKVLNKIKREKASGIVVVPDWPSHVWYPLFALLCIQQPLILEPNYN